MNLIELNGALRQLRLSGMPEHWKRAGLQRKRGAGNQCTDGDL